MDWVQVFKGLQQVEDGLDRLEDFGIPRARALAVIELANVAVEPIEISSVITQLGDLVDDAANAAGGE